MNLFIIFTNYLDETKKNLFYKYELKNETLFFWYLKIKIQPGT